MDQNTTASTDLNALVFIIILNGDVPLLTLSKSISLPSSLIQLNDRSAWVKMAITQDIELEDYLIFDKYNAITGQSEMLFEDAVLLQELEVSIGSRSQLDKLIEDMRLCGWDVSTEDAYHTFSDMKSSGLDKSVKSPGRAHTAGDATGTRAGLVDHIKYWSMLFVLGSIASFSAYFANKPTSLDFGSEFMADFLSVVLISVLLSVVIGVAFKITGINGPNSRAS